jgi:hypothetical protein
LEEFKTKFQSIIGADGIKSFWKKRKKYINQGYAAA